MSSPTPSAVALGDVLSCSSDEVLRPDAVRASRADVFSFGGGYGDGCDLCEANPDRRSCFQGRARVAPTASDDAAGWTVALSMVVTRDINAAKPAAK